MSDKEIIKKLINEIGLTPQAACQRLRRWKLGRISKEKLFAPGRAVRVRNCDRERPELLSKIPGETPTEKKYEKLLSGGPSWRY